jgi:hypothetical protein
MFELTRPGLIASGGLIYYILEYCNFKSFAAALSLLSAVQMGKLVSWADAKR